MQSIANERPLRICLASMAPFVGGAEVAAERLALGLRDAGHEVCMVLGTRAEVYERMERARLRCLHAPMYFTDKWHPFRYWRARNGLRQLLRRERPDVIHSNDLPTHQMVGDAARTLGVPRVCHHRFPFGGSCIDWLNKFGAERHLFVSEALMQEMAARSARLCESPREVVYDGLPLPRVAGPDERRQARGKLGLPLDRVLVLFAGQIIERKGVADLLRAWALLDPNCRMSADLVIVGDDVQGDGAYRVMMQELAAEVNVPAQFVGFQKNVGDWLTAADVAVVPSHVEPLGNATLEAMAHGLPVIGAAVGGIPEMIVEEETGLLVPPRSPEQIAQALARLLTEEGTRNRLGEAGRRRCEEKFTLEVHTRKVLEAYSHVLPKHQEVLAV